MIQEFVDIFIKKDAGVIEIMGTIRDNILNILKKTKCEKCNKIVDDCCVESDIRTLGMIFFVKCHNEIESVLFDQKMMSEIECVSPGTAFKNKIEIHKS